LSTSDPKSPRTTSSASWSLSRSSPATSRGPTPCRSPSCSLSRVTRPW
jgi:hypothetical protein